jgi:hypothetical protein
MDTILLRLQDNETNSKYLKDLKLKRPDYSKITESKVILKQLENMDQKVKKLESHLFINDRKDLLDIINSNILDPNKKFFGSKEMKNGSELYLQKNVSHTAFPPNGIELEYRNGKKNLAEENNKYSIKKKMFEKKSNLYINHIMSANFLKSPNRQKMESSVDEKNKENRETILNLKKSVPDLTLPMKEREIKTNSDELKKLIKNKEKFKEDIFQLVYKNINENNYINVIENYENKEEKSAEKVKKENNKIVIYCTEKKEKKTKTPKIIIKHDESDKVVNNLINEKDKHNNEKEIIKVRIRKNKNYLRKNPNPEKNTKKCSLKPFVYTILAIIRMKNLSNKDENLLQKMKKFIEFIESKQEEKLNIFIFDSIKTAYLSIANFNDLKLDLSERGSFFKCPEPERKDILVKLSIRLTTFFDNIIDNLTKDRLGNNLTEYLKYISSEGSYIPKEFYTNFELKRLVYSKNGCLK